MTIWIVHSLANRLAVVSRILVTIPPAATPGVVPGMQALLGTDSVNVLGQRDSEQRENRSVAEEYWRTRQLRYEGAAERLLMRT